MLTLENFIGTGQRYVTRDLIEAANARGVEPAVLQAVIEVETKGTGWFEDGGLFYPAILFERHKFYEYGKGKGSDDPTISNPKAGGYVSGMGEYRRLLRACEIDEVAALMSTSWGLGQIMGFNHKAAGCKDVYELVERTKQSETQQLELMLTLMDAWNMGPMFKAKDFLAIARKWNGAGQQGYDAKLMAVYKRLSDPKRQTNTRQIQEVLIKAGLYPAEKLDGLPGSRTTAAIKAFQQLHGLDVDGIAGPETLSAMGLVVGGSTEPTVVEVAKAPTKVSEIPRELLNTALATAPMTQTSSIAAGAGGVATTGIMIGPLAEVFAKQDLWALDAKGWLNGLFFFAMSFIGPWLFSRLATDKFKGVIQESARGLLGRAKDAVFSSGRNTGGSVDP